MTGFPTMSDRPPPGPMPYFLLAAASAPFALGALATGGWISGLAVWIAAAVALLVLAAHVGRM